MLALALAGGLLLTGCGGGADDGSSTDGAKGGSYGSGFPAPDQPQGEQNSGESRDGLVTPSPDHLSTFALDVDTASYG
ncbi:VWA domain-containing protein, partial [Streptomyces sp. RP5T]